MEGSLCPVLPAEAAHARELGDVRGHQHQATHRRLAGQQGIVGADRRPAV